MRFKTHCLALLSSFLFSFTAAAGDFPARGPLTFRPQNPIYLEFAGLRPTRAVVLPPKAVSLQIDNTYSSIFEWGIGDNFEELLDMEILLTALNLDIGVGHNMEVGIELPFLHFDGGFLDGFIQRYHNAFGFPNAGRDRVSNDSFTYRVRRGEDTIYSVGEKAFGVGDLTLRLRHNFLEEEGNRPAAAWLVMFKLPTGDRGEGLGSGSMDFSLGAALEKSYGRWHGYLNMAYFAAGGQDRLSGYHWPVYFAYSLAGEVNINRPISAVVQLVGGTPILKNGGVNKWDSFPMDLVIGLKGEHSPKWTFATFTWQAGFAEDINPEGPSGDFSVLAGLGIRFGLEKGYKGDWWAGGASS